MRKIIFIDSAVTDGMGCPLPHFVSRSNIQKSPGQSVLKPSEKSIMLRLAN